MAENIGQESKHGRIDEKHRRFDEKRESGMNRPGRDEKRGELGGEHREGGRTDGGTKGARYDYPNKEVGGQKEVGSELKEGGLERREGSAREGIQRKEGQRKEGEKFGKTESSTSGRSMEKDL